MASDAYFTLTALPVLDPPGAAPPISAVDLLERLPRGAPRDLGRAILLADDLHQREALRTGEIEAAEPAVLSAGQFAGTEPLPAELEPAERDVAPHVLPVDAIWEAYFTHTCRLARRLRSRFLQQWVAAEVRLRNELARTRARALGLRPTPYLVARELEGELADIEPALRAWLDAPDPLAGLRALIQARWRWIDLHAPPYTFAIDEYPAYAARLALLHRWQRSAGEQAARPRPGEAAG